MKLLNQMMVRREKKMKKRKKLTLKMEIMKTDQTSSEEWVAQKSQGKEDIDLK